MNYEEFKNEFVEALQERLSERGNEVRISVTNVEKMNESYEAITVTPAGSNIGMNLNLEVFAEAFENGVEFDEIVEQVTYKVEDHLSNMPTFDIQSLTDYEQMKDKISMEVVAADRNADHPGGTGTAPSALSLLRHDTGGGPGYVPEGCHPL